MASHPMLSRFDVNQTPAVEWESQQEAGILSSNSMLTNVCGKPDHVLMVGDGRGDFRLGEFRENNVYEVTSAENVDCNGLEVTASEDEVAKEELHQNLQGGFYEMWSGSREFLVVLMNHKIPIAVASTHSRKNLEETIQVVGAQSLFNAIMLAEEQR